MDPITIPADTGGSEFPAQLPDATWAEILAWFAENDVDLDLCSPTRPVIITNTIDRWQAPSERVPLPLRFVSSPVTVPLPAHLRVAIAAAVAGEEPSIEVRTPAEWCTRYGFEVVHAAGWHADGKPWHAPISEDEFLHRTSTSRLREIPLHSVQAIA